MSQFSSPEELEKIHVRDVYDQIAPRFSSLQHKAWPRVTEFLQSLPAGSVIADVGCGPGKYLGLVPSSFITGSDTCAQFVSTAREKEHEVCVCDNQLLPYRDGCFDAVISVGVIHHFASAKRRLGALQELARILRPGGWMLVYAWALEQSERKFSGQDVLVPYKGYHKNKDRGKRHKHVCHFAASDSEGREQNGVREKCLCSVISHESLIETKERHRQLPQARTTSQRKLQVESNGIATKDDQMQGKTARNGRHADNAGHVSNSTDGCKGDSKLDAFVARVADKILDRKEPSDHNSLLGGSSFVARIREKLRGLLPAQTDSGSLHGTTFLNFVSSRIFKRNENSFCAGYVDHDQGSDIPGCNGKSTEPICSTFDVVSKQPEHRPSHGKFCNGCTRSSTVNGTSVDSCASNKESLPKESVNGIGGRLLSRLLENISSSDTESDGSSSSGDCVVEENEISSVCGFPCAAKKAFQHTTLSCEEFQVTSSSSAEELNHASNGRDSAGQCQRFYHVFHQGELAELIQQGVPSLDVVEEYYDHANWAIISVKN